jgi:hypothetical protein
MSKKILLPLIILLHVHAAQGQIERMSLGEGSSYTLIQKQPKPLANQNLKDAEGVLLYEDFESYTNEFDPQRWSVKRSTDITGANLMDATTPMWFLCSPGSFYGNGYNYINSGSFSAAISYLANSYTWLISNDTLDVESNDLKLHFWLNYFNTVEQTTYFHVLAQNVDEGIWYNLESWGDNSPTNLYQQRVTISLDTLFNDGVEKFVIAFVYENVDDSGFQLALDDILVGTIEAPDLKISPYHLPYSMIPEVLVGTLNHTLNAYVQNLGEDYGDGSVSISVSIPELNNFESELSLTDSIYCGDLKIYPFPDLPNFINPNTYNINYSLNRDDKGIKENDSFQFAVTPNTFATDYCESSGIYGGVSSGKNIVFGNFYNIKDSVVASGIEIQWPEFSYPSSFKAYIYELNPVDSSACLIYQGHFQKLLQHSNSTQTYSIDPTFLTPGTNFFVAIQQIYNTPLGVGFDRIRNGYFWRLNSQQRFERVSNPSIGNVAIRLKIIEPINNPLLSFSVTDGEDAIEGATIQIEGENSISTNVDGFASLPLPNGHYIYTISKDGYINYIDTVKIQYANVHKEIILNEANTVTFTVKDFNENALENAEIFIAEQSVVTNSNGEAEVILPAGNYNYTVTRSGFSPYSGNITVIEDEEVEVILTETAETHTVSFEIVNQHLEEPMAGIRVSLSNYGIKYTNDDGVASYHGILPTESGLNYSLFKHGYYSKSGIIAPLNSDSIILDTLNIIRYSLIVQVVDTLGFAIIDASVSMNEESEQTDILGYAVISNVIPEVDMDLTISKEGYITHSSSVTIIDADIRKTIVLRIFVDDDDDNSSPVDFISPFKLYPNPNNGSFNVKGEAIFSIHVFDITGRLLISYINIDGIASIDLTNRAPGIYFVKVSSANYTKTFKTIKQ